MSDPGKPDFSDEVLILDYEFEAPPEKVWRAVTIPELRERWLPGCDLADTKPEASIPGEELRYRMRDAEPPFRESQVIFRIEPNADGGTHFRIIQRACEAGPKLPQPANCNFRLILAA